MVQGFFAKISKREKIVFCISLGFVMLSFLDRAILGPIFDKIKSLDSEIMTIEDNIKKNVKIIGLQERIEAEETRYATFAVQARSEEEETAHLLKAIEMMSVGAGVYLIDLKPSGIKSEGLVKKFMVNVSCEGQMEQLIKFMFLIEDADSLLQIGAFGIGPKSKRSTVARCELLVYKVVIP